MKQIVYIYNPEELRELIKEEFSNFLPKNSSLSQPILEDYWGIKRAAQYLNLSPHTLRKKAQKQEVPCFKRGRKYLFSREELNDYLLQGKCETLNSLGYDR